MRIVQHLQNSFFTRWIWHMWQHGETGRVVLLPLWKNPGARWHLNGGWKE